MFRKRQKKQFPPGTFIPTPARVCAIIQLCLAFSALLWNASEPFVGEMFTLKSRVLFYQNLMGIPAANQTSSEKTERLANNTERFKSLPKTTQKQLTHSYHLIQKQLQRSFWDKIKSVVSLFAYKISPYELAWIFFSIVISILLLKRVEGAAQAVWLLPLLASLYAADNRLYPKSNQDSLESRLFPTENELIANYIKDPLNENIFEQQGQMIQGWKRYLIIKWTNQIPSEDKTVFDQQAEEGEFNFTLARLKLRAETEGFLNSTSHPSPSFPLLALYFFWNVYYAYTAWRGCEKLESGDLAEIFSQISIPTPARNLPRAIVGGGGILKDAKKIGKNRLNLYCSLPRRCSCKVAKLRWLK